MQYITRYQKDNDGTYSVVATGVELEQRHIDLLENGYPLKADVEVPDHEKITHKQRRTIFLLCEDIELHLGQPKEAMRQDFQFELEIMNGYDPISLKNCSKKIATELIEMIIAFMFHHQVPMRLEASKLMKEDKSYLYWATINRNCVICGKPHADLAHYEAVGRGMNRNKMNHYDKHVLALCREHHNEQHAIGVKSFDDKYHLHDSWIKVDEKLNKMLKGEKKNE
ncbi:putative HNHc nuclease [Staphylococcus aureus]